MSASYPQLELTSRAQWRDWLAQNHSRSPGVWVVTWKKGSPGHLPMDEVVDEALCFGWVDSLPRTLDERRSQRLLTPRKPRSNWSRVNKAKVERLLAAGLMEPAGLAAVELARANGAWTALDATEDLVEPDDLRAALDAVPAARAQWDGFPRSAKRAILEWIGNARTESTRGRRVGETVAEAAAGRRANQWRDPGRVEAALLAERAQVRERLQVAERDYQRVVEAGRSVSTDDEHDPDGAGLAVERAQIVAFREQARDHLARIDGALERLSGGRYPVCEGCGGPIGAQRLSARPTATLCIRCAATAGARRGR